MVVQGADDLGCCGVEQARQWWRFAVEQVVVGATNDRRWRGSTMVERCSWLCYGGEDRRWWRGAEFEMGVEEEAGKKMGVFDKIINKEIPVNEVYEDDKVLAFRDISPQAPTHILLIPKIKDGLTGLSKAEERHCQILGHLLYTAKVVAKQEGLDEGFRTVINDGPNGCQYVDHIHVHLLGGRQMNWPPG
ncbi:hypothetical protein E3N88_10917 [Mikania micrantha]|uniref:HIT domain-containing protein n=1 Tax=Mikania micrantha TaxID=192012 RepID=A0A5N6PEW0_9ASTR|nr:hypothetical protein E3N88_10917 [Mikania micrantha]